MVRALDAVLEGLVSRAPWNHLTAVVAGDCGLATTDDSDLRFITWSPVRHFTRVHAARTES